MFINQTVRVVLVIRLNYMDVIFTNLRKSFKLDKSDHFSGDEDRCQLTASV